MCKFARTISSALVIFVSFLPSISFAEEKFLSCVLERLKMTGLVEMDTTDVSKFEEPLIKIDTKGEFWVYVGNQYNEEVFPDGIHADFVGKPDLPVENIYRWQHSAYAKVSGNDVLTDWTFSLSRDELILKKTREENLRAFGMPNGREIWTYSCRLVQKADFDSFKADMSARYMELNAKERQKAKERESKMKI